MNISINKNDIDVFINNYIDEYSYETIFTELTTFYTLTTSTEKYVLEKLIKDSIFRNKLKKDVLEERKLKLLKLKKLVLPEQRSKESLVFPTHSK